MKNPTRKSKSRRKLLPGCKPKSDADVILEWVDLQAARFQKQNSKDKFKDNNRLHSYSIILLKK